ncbi:hypothetical protein VXM67_13115 [Pseudomonas sp. Rh2]|uniref:hypothetical protein n=1 Tax=Pseudomonas TaxID=286 RepID=UPI0011DDD3DD|nr:hypothetical protein [Pseudomonas sp. VLB120]
MNNHTISSVVLESLAASADPDVRFDVAMKRRITRKTFETLAEDPIASMRHCIACNAKVPRDILEILAFDRSDSVARAAKKRL